MPAAQDQPAAVAPGARDAPLLRLRGATKTYGSGEVAVHALRDLDLDVVSGEMLAVVGPSGSGKSTFLHLAGGMARPTSGEVRFRDLDLASASDEELTEFRRRHVGFIFQFYNLVPTLTARENVEVACYIAEAPLDPGEALDRVGLAARADHFPAQLSGGEQQRVAIARALASDPELLLCDEPTGALDLATSRKVLGILRDCQRAGGKTVILITHNMALATLADRVLHLRDGALASLEVNAEPAEVEEVAW